MSRSRILSRVHRILRSQTGIERPPAPSLTRRDMLKIGTVALGALALPQGRRARATGRVPRIGIVGAGISGLTAALTLRDKGLPCKIYESSMRVGGRMHSNNSFWNEGQVSEWCGEFIDTDHHLIRHLARRFGLTLVNVNAADPPDSVDTNYFLGTYYTGRQLAADMEAVTPIIQEQRREIGPWVRYPHYSQAAYDFDHLNFYDWIETYVPGGHQSPLGRFLDLGMVTLNGLEATQQSALNFLLPDSSDETFHTQGGNEQIPAAIANSLPAGTVNLGWSLNAVAADDQTVTLSFDAPTGSEQEVFDFVILTLPFTVLRNLDTSRARFDALKKTCIDQQGYGTNSKLSLQFDDRYWNGRGAWPAVSNGFIETDLAFQSTWDSSRAELGADGLLTDYTGGIIGASYRPEGPYTDSTSSAVTAGYARRFLEQVDEVWPGVSAHYLDLATLSYPTGDPNLLGSYSAYKVGQITAFGGYQGAPQGRIFFGGEQCSWRFQGYMEGGAEEGRRAAYEVLAAAGATA